MKILVLLTTLGLAFGAATAVAEAQPVAPQAVHAQVVKRSIHSDQIESHDKGMALLFWVFAAVSIAGSIFVISRRNLIAAVMGMVGAFLGVAAVYMMLYATFLSVIQMLVYAGAIMVLFVFVIMILNRPEDEPIAPSGRAGQVIGGLAILYLVYRLATVLYHVTLPNPTIALAGPAKVMLPAAGSVPAESVEWGSVRAVGYDLFNGGLFPFEAISILLLVAVVGASAIAKPLHEDQATVGDDPNPGAH